MQKKDLEIENLKMELRMARKCSDELKAENNNLMKLEEQVKYVINHYGIVKTDGLIETLRKELLMRA